MRKATIKKEEYISPAIFHIQCHSTPMIMAASNSESFGLEETPWVDKRYDEEI